MRRRLVLRALIGVLTLIPSNTARAQDPQDQQPVHDMSHMNMSDSSWTFMQDGLFTGLFNHQGGPRGGQEAVAPNWWMGMFSRSSDKGQLTLTGMFSADAATVGKRGYGELFQMGEAIDGQPNVDRQHPHDLFMQLSAAWRTPVSDRTTLTLAAAPVGEPAIGPISYMHRASEAAIVFAPLGHHTFDSTHISFGVLTAGISRGRWTAEASLFNGREPDDNRWDLDFGRLDSVAGRLWFRPSDEWAIQLSTARLVQPEELEPGNVIRTTVSGSWTRTRPDALSAVTVGYGRNDHVGQQALFGEFTLQRGANTFSGRLELVQVESEVLNDRAAPVSTDGHGHQLGTLGAFTVGGLRRIGRWRGLEAAIGANGTAYGVPSTLVSSHGSDPLSFQLFVQIRPHVGGMGPMWNMRMGE